MLKTILYLVRTQVKQIVDKTQNAVVGQFEIDLVTKGKPLVAAINCGKAACSDFADAKFK